MRCNSRSCKYEIYIPSRSFRDLIRVMKKLAGQPISALVRRLLWTELKYLASLSPKNAVKYCRNDTPEEELLKFHAYIQEHVALPGHAATHDVSFGDVMASAARDSLAEDKPDLTVLPKSSGSYWDSQRNTLKEMGLTASQVEEAISKLKAAAKKKKE